ncbi:M50 family metallopeptidase [Prescottella equi]|uniref:M50 family metallopeptidase n=1 Tax=Rhodococcus hoagii TaxID=43767 RepID=UPI000D10A5A4|nr:site-2 protease family protein [Prescottella equi]AVP68272.1 zinc metalloprotease [Prescottella equi]NKR43537.1 zinc metalloprotease [Prescottella equi]NKS16726.1 zinc metalloprotease [Prescottella equi]
MVFAIGVLLFALGIGASIALHEAGHMWTAKALGMKVRRYYIGFGPKIFSFRRGETEYGLKAIPAGGFCDIAGMTAVDELAPDEVDRAMYKQKAWKRIVVMSGGIAMNFLLGFVLLVVLAVGWGLPNPETRAVVEKTVCVSPTQAGPDGGYELSECVGDGPAAAAGIRAGDVITAVNGQETATFGDVVKATQPLSGMAEFTVDRDGETLVIPVQIEQVQRWVNPPGSTPEKPLPPVSQEVGAIGVGAQPSTVQYSLPAAIPASVVYTGDIFVQTAHALTQMPSKVVDLWDAVTGGERDLDTPISVVGASVIGGQMAERGYIDVFIGLLATLNFFLGIFNLLPLLPLDGGHIAVTIYEKIRNSIRKMRGLAAGGPVDYMKLMPITYVVVVIGGAYMLLTLTADIVNPIQLFP